MFDSIAIKMVFEELREQSWLRNKGDNVWWNHTGSKQELYGRDMSMKQKFKVSYAPGWSSLLPATANGVDAGLQCPMCKAQKHSSNL